MNTKEKLQAILAAANATTGETDTTLTDAVQRLVDGYGSGGSVPPVVEEVEQYTEEQLAAMSNAELQAVMADMGIGGTMNKANMVALIMSHQ